MEGCYNLIDKPTRITDNSSTIIDHIYTNIFDKPLDSGILSYDISDHLPVYCSLRIGTSRNCEPILRRCSKNYKAENFVDDICIEMDNIQTKYQDHKSKISGNSLFTTFISSFTQTHNKHAPLVELSKKKMKTSLKPWLTQGILKSIKTKNSFVINVTSKTIPSWYLHTKNT